MCVHVYMFACVNVSVRAYLRECVCECACVFACMRAFVHLCVQDDYMQMLI